MKAAPYIRLLRVIGIAGVLVLPAAVVMSQQVQFHDDFKRSELGPRWRSATGSWVLDDSLLSISSRNHDDLITSAWYVYATQAYSLQVDLRGARAGLYFGIDDRQSKCLSQMVRFDDKSVLAGYFDGRGEFTTTSVFNVPEAADRWTTLRVDVEPSIHRFKVFVDDRLVGQDSTLMFSSGYIGLEASDGRCEFRSIRVLSERPSRPPAAPEPDSPITLSHISSVRCHKNEVAIYSPDHRYMVTLDARGRVVNSQPATDPLAWDELFERNYMMQVVLQ